MNKIYITIVLLMFTACSYQAFDEVDEYLQSTSMVTYTYENLWHVFNPVSAPENTGVIFYPGGLVEPTAYAPLCHRIAENGYMAVLTPMPFDLAIFGIYQALSVIDRYKDRGITRWVIMGHSLGGAMACYFVRDNPSAVSGLVLMGSYPADDADMSAIPVKALSIYAEFNEKSNEDEQMARKKLMPADTVYYEILGGNHARFGYYGPQTGDGEATISLQQQQNETLEQILIFLSGM